MRLPPNARRFRGRPPVVEEDDPLLAFRRTQGQGGTATAPAVDTTTDPLTRFRAKYSGTDPIDIRPVSSESTRTRSPAPAIARPTIGPRVLDPETDMERGVGRAAAAYQGFTFGAGDKIAAGIKTLLPEFAGGSKGWDFRENLRNARTPLNDYRARHPVESTVAEIAGGLPSVMATAPLSISARLAEAPAALRLAGLMGEGAVMGGTVGGLDAIQPDATLADVGRGAATGAATGAIATPIVAPIVSGAVRGATRAAARFAPAGVADRIAGFMGGDPVTPRGKAKAAITGALESGGVNPAEAAKTTGLIEPARPTGDPILSILDERGVPIARDGTVEVYVIGEPGSRKLSLAKPAKGGVTMRVPIDQVDRTLAETATHAPARPSTVALPEASPTPEQRAQFDAERIARNEAVGLDEGRAAPTAAAPYQFPDHPVIGNERKINGLDVGTKIDNQASIDATFDHEHDYRQLPGIREIALEGETGPNSVRLDARTRRLAEEIKTNNRIDPLIWVDDPSGGYVLEGSHRIDALRSLGHKSFPAVVVQDLTEWTPESIERARIAKGEAPAASRAVAPASGAAPMAGRTANDDIVRIANEYRQTSGVSGTTLEHPGKVDAEKAGVMAHAYEALKNDPTDPEVIAAYRALATETRAQAKALRAAGYEPEFMTDDPYKNSAEMMKDLGERKKIRVFKTNKENPHPLLSDEENDLFRWVHDVFGHAQSGNQFGPLGEERAFRDHASMFSPLARRAMATETRGQNSWVNFGPNADLPVASRPYAEQKAAVFPRELTGDYGNIPRESPTTVMELGSRQVPSLVRAARNVPTSTAGQTTDRFLTERAAGAGKRIERALNEATGHEAGDTWMPVEQLIQKRAGEARPLYEDAENYGPIKNPETVAQIAQLRKHPVFARAWARGQAMAELEGSSATRRVVTQEGAAEIPRIAPDSPPPAPAPVPSGKPTSTREAIAAFQDRSAAAASRREGTSIQQQAREALERRSAEAELPDAPRRLVGGALQEPRAAVPEESMQAPTVQQINRWKKGLDAVIQSGYGSENAISREEARLFRQKLNEVLAAVDEEVPAFKKARQSFAGNSELVEASESGADHFKPGTPTGALERQLASYSPGELEVYRTNALNKLVEKIRTVAVNPDMPEAGRSTNILQRIMGTEDASERLGMLFPDEKSFETFLKQVEDEALYPKTDRFLRNQSSTAAQLAEGGVSIKTWADLAKSPFSGAARFRLAKRVAEGSMANDPLPPKVANEVAELATTTGYRLRALLQEMAADKAGREAGRRRLLSFSNAALAGGVAPAATEVERRRRMPPDEGR